MKRTEIIESFLKAYTHPDLAALYNRSMEVQVNVAQDGGDRVDKDFKGRRWSAWSDGIQTWYPFRIPRNANTEPEDNDIDLNYDLTKHAEGIGMTGWDWVDKLSRWVAFDFDAITGHSNAHDKKLSEAELKEIKDVVSSVPWVTVRYSTSGKGLHLYVFLKPTPTDNHTEHAALARAILGNLAAFTGFDFQSKVDICGGNMWVWHRKMKGTNGLELIKQGTILKDIPPNWRDHLIVVSGKRNKSVPTFIADSESEDIEKLFDELSGQRSRIPLDSEHKKLINYLQDIGVNWWWDQDHNMLVTHTSALKRAHDELGMRGIFETMASGKDTNDINCYAYPMRRGAWTVRRYTPGVQEVDTWTQDGQGWTRCYLNQNPDLPTVARALGAVEHPSGGFVFREAEVAQKAALQLGVDFKIWKALNSRKTKLKENKDGRLIVEIVHDSNDLADEMQGWLAEKGQWKRIFNNKISTPIEPEIGNYDDSVRHLVTESNEDFGWVIKTDNEWRHEPLTHVKSYLKGLGLVNKDVEHVIGSSIAKCWTVVNRPFQPEYIGDRKWNRGAVQLRFIPNENTDNLKYPTWLSILEHCGQSLDDVIKDNPWAKSNGILTGADYLKCWIASLIQQPIEPLPYLFLHGPQDSGKSILHEAIELLVTCGVNRADTALINQSGFNAEIEKSILCVVEETDLGNNKMAYNRIKDWVTSRRVSIHRKRETPYSVLNTTHWIHCSNERSECPIFPGDTRITMLHVPNLDPTQMIPKKQIIPILEKEAPDFLAEILNLELPPSNDRLNVPVVVTDDKRMAEESNKSLVDMFLDECTYPINGSMIKYSELWDRFKEWLDPNYHHQWSKIRFGKEITSRFPKGRNPENAQFYIGNISFDPDKEPTPKLVMRKDKLVPCQ